MALSCSKSHNIFRQESFGMAPKSKSPTREEFDHKVVGLHDIAPYNLMNIFCLKTWVSTPISAVA